MEENKDAIQKTEAETADVPETEALEAAGDGPAESQPGKPHESKRYLVFYVIGLFCVALVLILLSYITQVRADRKLNELSTRLTTQTSAVEGANARVQVLQETVEEQNTRIAEQNAVIAAVQKALGAEGEAAMVESAGLLAKQKDALYQLLMAQTELNEGKQAAAKQRLDKLVQTYGLEALDGTGKNPLLHDEVADLFVSLRAQAEEPAAE